MITYYLRNGSKLFIIYWFSIILLFTYFKFSFLKILLCVTPFSFDYIHKERQKEINISRNIFSMFNGKFKKSLIKKIRHKTLPKMGNLDYVTNYIFHHAICKQ